MKTYIYMVRHAESPYVFGEERARGLSDDGFQAAVKIADILDKVDIDCVVSSTYLRAIQTVEVLAKRKGLPIIEYDELRERPIMGLDYKAPWEELLAALEQSFSDHDYCLTDGESTKQAQGRSIPILLRLLQEYEGKSVAVGTHGNIMTIIMNYFDPAYGYEFWQRTSKPDLYKMTFHGNQLENVERLWSS